MAALGRLSAGLTHELNNPASAVARSAGALPQSLDLQKRAERILKQFPEVVDVVSKTGRADIAAHADGDRFQRPHPRRDHQRNADEHDEH